MVQYDDSQQIAKENAGKQDLDKHLKHYSFDKHVVE